MKFVLLSLVTASLTLEPHWGEEIKKGDIFIKPAEIRKITKVYKFEDGFGDDAAHVLRTFIGKWDVIGCALLLLGILLTGAVI